MLLELNMLILFSANYLLKVVRADAMKKSIRVELIGDFEIVSGTKVPCLDFSMFACSQLQRRVSTWSS